MGRTVVRRGRRSAPVDVEQDDGDYGEEERSSRRSTSRRRGSRSRDEVEDRGGRTPTRRTSRKGSARRRGGRGWDSVAQARKESSNFPDRFKVDGKEKIAVKFLQDEPFDTYYEHWLNELPKGTKKSYVCIAEDADGTGCPLCEMGKVPAFRASFNIVDMSSGKDPKLQIWNATPDPQQQIEEAREDWGDLSAPDLYFRVSKSQDKKTKRWNYKVERLKSRDLIDDMDIDPLTEEEIEDFKLYDESATEDPSYEDLSEIAEMLEEEE